MIGVILLDHGEPPEYNEQTYYSFRNFAQSLITIGIDSKGGSEGKARNNIDVRNNFFATKPHPTPDWIDAWLRPHPVIVSWLSSIS